MVIALRGIAAGWFVMSKIGENIQKNLCYLAGAHY
jgi:hypothetical protein